MLADDLKVRSVEDESEEEALCERHYDCVKATLNFFEAMGAKIAANKSLSLGNNAGLRKKLKKMAWDGKTIPVACDARDLGSHVCLGKRQVETTVTKRIGDALE